MPSTRELLRLARRIHAAYQQRNPSPIHQQNEDWRLLERCFQEVQVQRRLVRKARSHGWHLAAQRVQETFRSVFLGFSQSVRQAQQRLIEPVIQIPSLTDLLDELHNLHVEFERVVIDIKNKTLAVHTDFIELDEVRLGRFAMRLHWPLLAVRTGIDCFDVVALDPHRAASNSDVTHPHVKDGNLCAGDATSPLKSALAQGRFTDAFCLIHSVLSTYNRHSAYVRLDDWGGFVCHECGARTNDEDRFNCDDCDNPVCADCTSSCLNCDRIRCVSCQMRCDICEDHYCRGCLKKSACSELRCCSSCLEVCLGCDAEVASSELDEETYRCPKCLEEAAETSPDIPANDVNSQQ